MDTTCAVCGEALDGEPVTVIGVQRQTAAHRGCGDQWWIDYAEGAA